MKKLFLSLLILALMAGSAQAITGHTYVENVGYSQGDFIISTSDADSAAKKIVLFYGAVTTSVIRKDSLTSSITNPDTISKAVGTFVEGTTYYWYVTIEDSTSTITIPSDGTFKTFTTTDLQQNTTVSSVSYSSANIIVDTTGVYPGVGLDSIRLDIDKTDGTTYSASITTVTIPQDTFAVSGLDEGATYFCRTIAFLTDSSAADTLTAISFTTTDMAMSFTLWKVREDSAFFFVDSTVISVDSVIMQWGAGARVLGFGIAGHTADTTTTVTYPDTIIITGLITDGVYVARLISFDAVAIDTSATLTITMISYPDAYTWHYDWGEDVHVYDWTFTQSSQSFSTGWISVTGYNWMRSSLKLWGEDDVATYDSVRVLRYANTLSGNVLLDTLLAGDIDTASLSGDIFRLGLAGPDSLLDAYPIFTHEGFIEVIADMSDSSATGFNDSTLGTRKVYLTVEIWK